MNTRAPITASHSGVARRNTSAWSVYRFHLEDPIRFETSLRVSIEHGHANDQSNDYSSVAYWYQAEPHAAHPDLAPQDERLPRRWPEHGLWDE